MHHRRQHLVLREESRERRNAGNREAADEECYVGDWHILAKSAHFGVVVGMDCVDNRTGTEEEQSLEHGVSKQVEHRRHIAEAFVNVGHSHAERRHHEGNLRNRGERKHTLDVDLRTSDDCGIERRDGTHNCDKHQSGMRHQINREHTSHQEHTSDNHRGGVDERRNGRRAFHSVGKPNVERHHCRLTHTTREYQHESPCQHRCAHKCSAASLCQNRFGRNRDCQEVECLSIE